jgi:peptide/nickel transport system substrate-binding protein
MTRRPTWLSAAVIGGTIALLAGSAAPVFAQDGPGDMPEGGWTSYPVVGEVDCDAGTYNGLDYSGQLKSITATDDTTVVFDLCNPDPAFLSKIAFSAFAINDAGYLNDNAASGALVDQPNGTGPYVLDDWRRGSEIIYKANENYWGDPVLSDTVVLRWSSEPGQKLIELQSGTVDGIAEPSGDDLESIEADPNLKIEPREGLNVFYIGMNNAHPPFDNQKVRQAIAQGIDRNRIMSTFYPEGSNVAQWFTPCSIAFACEGEEWYEFDPAAAQALLAEGLAEVGMDAMPEIPISLRVVDRVYLPFPEQVAVDIQDQLMENLGISAFIDVQESGTFIDNADAGALTGLHLLGWGADYPDPTNFLDFHFGPGASAQFGAGFQDIWDALAVGSTSADPAVRAAAYVEANNAVKANIPMVPVAAGGSATAWTVDIEGAHSSPLTNEEFKVVGPGADDQLVFMQSAEPIGLYCADETDGESLRACEQLHESLYGFEIAGTTPEPKLATDCSANEDLTQWTCSLRDDVTFHDGSTFEAADVVTSYAVSWDINTPLHVGRDGSFTYMSGLWGGFLNQPPAAAE